MTSKRKKILFVVTDSHFGGRQKYILDLITNMDTESFDIAVCIGGSGEFIQVLQEKNITIIPIRMLGRSVTFFGDLIAFLSLGRVIFNEQPDILHLNSTKTGVMGGILGRLYNGANMLRTLTTTNGVRIVFTAHGWAFAEERTKVSRLFLKFVQWLTVLFSHITIAVSHDTRRQMSEALFIRNKIRTVHNGIEKHILTHRQVARKRLFPNGIPEEAENAVWIGTISDLHRNKGIATTINAIAQLPNHKEFSVIFVVIGSNQGEERHLRRLIKGHSLENNVFLVGSHVEAKKLLKAFDIFTLTSVKEGFPYVLLEAATAGLPVLASAVGGVGEIISDMKSGILTQPHNSTEVTHALRYYLENKKKRAELADALYAHVSANFSLEKMVAETIRLYE